MTGESLHVPRAVTLLINKVPSAEYLLNSSSREPDHLEAEVLDQIMSKMLFHL